MFTLSCAVCLHLYLELLLLLARGQAEGTFQVDPSVQQKLWDPPYNHHHDDPRHRIHHHRIPRHVQVQHGVSTIRG